MLRFDTASCKRYPITDKHSVKMICEEKADYEETSSGAYVVPFACSFDIALLARGTRTHVAREFGDGFDLSSVWNRGRVGVIV